MEMKDMKLSPEERKEQSEPTALGKGPEYPWGLQLRISDEEYDKLFTESPKVGSMVTIQARAKVVSVSQREQDGDGDSDRTCELQITEMGVEAEKAEKEASETMYSKG